MALPFLFLVRLRITDCTIELDADVGFCGLQEVRNNFISNPVWDSKVGRLKKVKDRLKNIIR